MLDTVIAGYRPAIGFVDCDPLRCAPGGDAGVRGVDELVTVDDRGRNGSAVVGADWLLLVCGRRRDVVILTIQSACRPRSDDAVEGNCSERA